jgi:hypothetical protein
LKEIQAVLALMGTTSLNMSASNVQISVLNVKMGSGVLPAKIMHATSIITATAHSGTTRKELSVLIALTICVAAVLMTLVKNVWKVLIRTG